VGVLASGPEAMMGAVGREVDRCGFHWRKLNFYI
jgi:hypothetical protein